jgi:prepilin peptidase CpaA
MSLPPLAVCCLLTLLVLTAAVFDLRSNRIPNWLTLSGLLLALALNVFLFELPGLWYSLKGLGLAFGIYFVLYLLRGMGAGDVKLMAAIGAAAGPWNWLGILFLTAILGGIAALALAFAKQRVHKTLWNMALMLQSLRYGHAPYRDNPELDVQNEQALRLPHAVIIAVGTLAFIGSALIWAPR